MAPFIYSSDYPPMTSNDSPTPPGKPPKKPHHPPRTQSRETGDIVPQEALSFAKSWNHFFAGG